MNTHIIGDYPKAYIIQRFLTALNDGGALFLDPDGEAADTILSLPLPKREVLVIDPIDSPVGFNILSNVKNKPLLTSLVLSTVKAIWKYDNIPTPVLDRTLYNTLACLLEYPNATLLDVEPMLTDKSFRADVLEHVSDPYLKRKWAYWETKKAQDYDKLIQSTENKAGEFAEDPRIRASLGHPTTTFDLPALISRRAIIILKLPRRELGQKTALFGSLFLAYLLSVQRRGLFPFHVFIDGVHHFDTPIVPHLLESRYSVTVANRYLGQLSPELRTGLLGACERRVMFRVGIEDSTFLHKTIPENNTAPKAHELEPREMLTLEHGRIKIEKSAHLKRGNFKRAKKLIEQSRRRYGVTV